MSTTCNQINESLLHYSRVDPCAENFKQSMGARYRVGIGLSYRPARLHSLAELFPWNRFLGFVKEGERCGLRGGEVRPGAAGRTEAKVAPGESECYNKRVLNCV